LTNESRACFNSEVFRHSATEAIVLKTTAIGEIHKGVTLFTPDGGLVTAIAHGAKKMASRLRSATEPFCLSRVYLYEDPVRRSVKITDMEPIQAFDSLRRSLRHFYTVSTWAEVVLRSFGGGEQSRELYALFRNCLREADARVAEEIPRLSVQFGWRFLGLEGSRPDLDRCTLCNRRLGLGDHGHAARGTTGIACERCSGESAGIEIGPGVRRYLAATSAMVLGDAMRVGLTPGQEQVLSRWLYDVIEEVLEMRLNSLEALRGLR
jgi:DNA repair protein RecO (recombination protein O)